jgi:hypothetical protein
MYIEGRICASKEKDYPIEVLEHKAYALLKLINMITLSPKALAVAAIAMSLSSSVSAYLDITAYVGNSNYFSDGAYGNITTVDNDIQTCSGNIGTEDKDIGDMFLSFDFLFLIMS